MSHAENPWLAEHWCKPFGAQSNEREWHISTGGRPSGKTGYLYGGDKGWQTKEFRARLLSMLPGGHSSSEQYALVPSVHLKVYAHDRLVFTVLDRVPKGLGRVGSNQGIKDIVRGDGTLVSRRETRRGFQVGGRLRFRPPYNGFTVRARNMVMDVAHIVETSKEGQGVFVTLTMAGGTRLAYACMAAASGYIADRMNRWLRYKVSNGLFVYVWELQERGAPHMHYLFRVPDGVDVDAFGRDLQSQWRKILLDVSAESGVDCFARDEGGTWREEPDYPRCQTKRLDGTYARYISKYCSKERTKGGIASPFRPGRWWGVSYAGRKEVAKRRLDVWFPVRSLALGIQLANTICAAGGEVCLDFKWLELPPGACMSSVSIFTGLNRCLDVGKAILSFVGTGDLAGFSRVLKAINLSGNTS